MEIQFEETKISHLEFEAFLSGVECIEQATNAKHNLPIRKDRVLPFAFRNENLVFSFATRSFSRPPKWEMIVVCIENYSYLTPSVSVTDFFEVSKLMSYNTVEEAALLLELSQKWYGASVKGVSPKRILTLEDLSLYGLDYNLMVHIQDGLSSLWWQPWGGILYSLKILTAPPTIDRQIIGTGTGLFFSLPRIESR
jgi:hypothetical protein